jgi:hypothetical protein
VRLVVAAWQKVTVSMTWRSNGARGVMADWAECGSIISRSSCNRAILLFLIMLSYLYMHFGAEISA